MDVQTLEKIIQTSTGTDLLQAVQLAGKPQFKRINYANLNPCPKRYFSAFLESYQTFKVNKIKTLEICEENLEKLLLPFASKDELRPPMQGFFIDNDKIVATDAHKMAILPNYTDLQNGIVRFNKIAKEPTTDKFISYSDSRYPDYNAVIPKNNPIQKVVNIQGLRKVLTLAKKWKLYQYTENSGNQVFFKIDSEIFAVNGNFLLDVVTLFEKLNCQTCIASFDNPSRAIVFEYGRILVLLMPVMLEETEETDFFLDLTEFFTD